ncbi:hypothetical protein ES705_40868 [subsurface metagenome]
MNSELLYLKRFPEPDPGDDDEDEDDPPRGIN